MTKQVEPKSIKRTNSYCRFCNKRYGCGNSFLLNNCADFTPNIFYREYLNWIDYNSIKTDCDFYNSIIVENYDYYNRVMISELNEL